MWYNLLKCLASFDLYFHINLFGYNYYSSYICQINAYNS